MYFNQRCGQTQCCSRESLGGFVRLRSFFVSNQGHIVTNAHVVEGCREIMSSRGGRLKLLAVDQQSDLALYLATERPSSAVRLRGGRGPRAGEAVVALGFPLKGLLSSDPIVTTGIISALDSMRLSSTPSQIRPIFREKGPDIFGGNRQPFPHGRRPRRLSLRLSHQ
jgi:S1-C subfamily serine protease